MGPKYIVELSKTSLHSLKRVLSAVILVALLVNDFFLGGRHVGKGGDGGGDALGNGQQQRRHYEQRCVQVNLCDRMDFLLRGLP